jgi:hypothetical protein
MKSGMQCWQNGCPVGCHLFNNRKCGNKKKCVQTQEEKTGATPMQDKLSNLKFGR